MKRTYPDHYRISAGEQVHRLAGLGRAALAAVSGGRAAGAGPGNGHLCDDRCGDRRP